MQHHREKRAGRRVRLLLELELEVPADIAPRHLGPQLVSMATSDFDRIVVAYDRAELDGEAIDVAAAPWASPWRRFLPPPDPKLITAVRELEAVTRQLVKAVAPIG